MTTEAVKRREEEKAAAAEEKAARVREQRQRDEAKPALADEPGATPRSDAGDGMHRNHRDWPGMTREEDLTAHERATAYRREAGDEEALPLQERDDKTIALTWSELQSRGVPVGSENEEAMFAQNVYYEMERRGLFTRSPF